MELQYLTLLKNSSVNGKRIETSVSNTEYGGLSTHFRKPSGNGRPLQVIRAVEIEIHPELNYKNNNKRDMKGLNHKVNE